MGVNRILFITTTLQTGWAFEQRAAEFLECRGYAVLDRNFRTRRGEIDIVAKDRDTVVFVEVRARSSVRFGTAAETVGPVKRARIVHAARMYATLRGLDCPMRFDVIAVSAGKLEHIADAFTAG
jgi:putative endonuclease